MRVLINGEMQDIAQAGNIADLICQLQLDSCKTAVSINRVIIPKGHHQTTALADGDEIEIVEFIGGG